MTMTIARAVEAREDAALARQEREEERAELLRRLDVMNAEEKLERADWLDLSEHITDATYNIHERGINGPDRRLGELLVTLRANADALPEAVHTAWVALFDHTAECLADQAERERERQRLSPAVRAVR